jgi:SAM-dependent methyltransferase
MIAVLYPRFHHPAIEERYASWQTQMLLRAAGGKICSYDPEEPSSYAVGEIDDAHVLVITDPILLPPARLAERLVHVLESEHAAAALPVSNEAANEAQRCAAPAPYATLRELQIMTASMQQKPESLRRVKWDGADPAAYVCRTALLDDIDDPPRRALAGREVVLSDNDYIHRWSSFRGQARHDLLARISTEARSILEFGCGEAPLGAELKRRQHCRVVGIELDPKAAAIARKRIDDVYCGDVREVVSIIQERFDWIVGGDIVEHLDEPWSFLADLRRVCKPGGYLLLSLPNVANASVVGDLLHGRFDYVYMGLTCVGHLRFMTRRSIEEMLAIAGWQIADIVPQELAASAQRRELVAQLEKGGVPFSKSDLDAAGYYVVARNPS